MELVTERKDSLLTLLRNLREMGKNAYVIRINKNTNTVMSLF